LPQPRSRPEAQRIRTVPQLPRSLARLRILGWGALAALLAAPLVAMQVTHEVAWSPFDFIAEAALLALVGAGMEIAVRGRQGAPYRAAAAVALIGSAAMIWATLAVGIIGTESDPANLVFPAIPALGLAIALLGGFGAANMARAMGVMALAQLAAGAALGASWSDMPPFTLGFAALWIIATALFRRARNNSR
jgi:hypothetical protein